MQRQRRREGKITPFILKLAQILDDPQHHRLASWTPCGQAFAIHDPQLFAASLLPKFFRHNNYGSFLRQLSFYNFNKLKTPIESVHKFQHPLFLRDEQHPRSLIKRVRPDREATASQSNTPSDSQNEEKGIEGKIANLKKNQMKLMQQCREVVEQSVETIEWGLIRSAEIENDSGNNQLICNRILDFLGRYPHLATHLAYLDTALVAKLLEHLDSDLVDYLATTPYQPAIQKFFGMIENNELSTVVDCINSGVVLEKKKKSFRMGKEKGYMGLQLELEND